MALGAIAVLLLLANAATGLLQPCVLLGSDRVAESCAWQTLTPQNSSRVVGQHPFSPRGMPVLVLPDGAGTLPPTAPGFRLVLRRVVLANAVLAPPEAAAPVLWPLGLFSATAAHLAAADVRLAVSDEQLQQHLRFFAAAGADIHTDDTSFLHIPNWSNDATSLRSVTLLAGACRPSSSALALALAPAVSYSAACGVRAVDNATLVPTLLRDAAASTPRPLLVLVAANVSLGAGLGPGAISIRRPLVLAGLFTRPTSVDLGMVVNQLNASCPASQSSACHAAVFWHSLVLENAAPGDAISSIIAPPYSSALSANIWALYCNRTSKCLRLQNTTTVLANQAEMDYITFMYSMFDSPLPSMRQVTNFYHTDLHITTLKFHPGPGDDAITITNMTSDAWSLVDGIWTTQAQVAPRLPVPGGLQQLVQATRAGPLVQAVDSCSSLQAALQTPSSADRMRVAMLLSNVSITRECWQTTGSVQYMTQIFGQLPGSAAAEHALTHNASGQQQQQNQQALAEQQPAAVHTAAPVPDVFTLGFGFTAEPPMLQLPQSPVPDQFLRLQNVTLAQLPQGPDAARAAGAVKYQPGESGPTPADVWTILLWPVRRPLSGSPVYMADVQLMVPLPEYDYIAHLAASAGAFVVQLQNSPGLTFTFTTVEGNAVRIGAFQGHGISGQNMWLLPDPAASMQQPYVWPFADSAASAKTAGGASSARGSQTVLVAGVVAGVGSVALLLLGLAAWWLWRRRQEQEHQQMLAQLPPAAYKPGGSTDSSRNNGSPSSRSLKSGVRVSPCGDPGDCISVSVCQLAGDRCLLCDEQLPADARHGRLSKAASSPDQSDLRRCCTNCAGDTAGSDAAAAAGSAQSVCIGQLQLDATPDHVAAGLQRWRSAVSSTTLQLMERRMGGGGQRRPRQQPSAASSALQPPGSADAAPGAAAPDSAAAAAAAAACSMQIMHLLGQGSFGCVYLATWRGKRVAVKVMQLPANALLEPQEQLGDGDDEGEQQLSAAEHQRRRRARQLQHNSPPHMAIMEAVVSSTMSHPNVVQVFTYMLNPLTASSLPDQDDGGDEQPQEAAERGQNVSGWELKLVMEFCDQGTLRDALDCRKLHSGSAFLAPALVLSLAHDVAAAMLHLHSEGIVHGDLKAANVMLTRGGLDPGLVWAATVGYRVTAKVADFGLALPLHGNDTHATMAARGTPTHMSPELFMSGHVSRASDVFAFGILLFEVMTGQRAYAGVPIPLLPHEVARQGLRPQWPTGLPPGCRDLRHLAEACWAQQPQDRPSFLDIFRALEAMHGGSGSQGAALASRPGALPQVARQDDAPLLTLTPQLEPQSPAQGQPQQLLGPVAGRGSNPSPVAMSWSKVTMVQTHSSQLTAPGG